MKALISPIEIFTHQWETSWSKEWYNNNKVFRWVPATISEIENCQRVAQVEQDENVFDVAEPSFWVDCPEDCKADDWYYKDGQLHLKPVGVDYPLE